MNEVLLDQVTFCYNEVIAADAVSLRVEQGEFFALLGPSGSGKTTILRLIAGFLQPQSGSITIGGRNMVGVPPYERNIGFVFQNYALFPHMTIAQNVAFGLESQHLNKTEIGKRVTDVLELVQLRGLADRRPAQVSGGQQQRVALARAIVTQPSVLLLDEPLAALDKKLRSEMQVELHELQRRLAITTLFVTHDQEEALSLADRLAVMDLGRIVQIGPPQEVYEHPQTRFVTDFMGEANLFDGQVTQVSQEQVTIAANSSERIVGPPKAGLSAGQSVAWAVRPENVRVALEPPPAPFALPATVRQVAYRGASIDFHLSLRDGAPFTVFAQRGLLDPPPAIGQAVYLWWEPQHTLILTE
ncbi:MAG TPA: ABC transporter ATP-binding protein [Caldilineaceae bacterium]|nr:ABC transporter ATP-binding protein [Caldilineaceae bacterium]